MLFLDLETRSDCDLIFHGLRRYAEDPSTEVICMAYAFDDGDIQFWWDGEDFPGSVLEHIEDAVVTEKLAKESKDARIGASFHVLFKRVVNFVVPVTLGGCLENPSNFALDVRFG